MPCSLLPGEPDDARLHRRLEVPGRKFGLEIVVGQTVPTVQYPMLRRFNRISLHGALRLDIAWSLAAQRLPVGNDAPGA